MVSSPLGAIGIDVSEHQGNINWPTMRANGVEFAIVKVGHTFGKVDPGLARHRDGARAAGLAVGFYWYAYGQLNPEQEARNFVRWSGRRAGEPMFLDAEDPSLYQGWVQRFLAEVDRLLPSGVRCHVYSYWSYITERRWMDACIGNRALWIAVYNSLYHVPVRRQAAPRGMTAAAHQFTSSMVLPGYGKRLDVNLWYGGVNAFRALGSPNGSAPAPVPSGPRDLSIGDTGPDVLELQKKLNARVSGARLALDSSFGKHVDNAVRVFQTQAKAAGIYTGAVDGRVGPLTRKALDTPAPKPVPVPAPKPVPAPAPKPVPTGVNFGEKSPRVAALQRELNRLFPSYIRLVVDESYGLGTKAAVLAFQKRAKAEGRYSGALDGLAGALTFAALRSYGAKL